MGFNSGFKGLNNRLLNNLYESKEIFKGYCNNFKLARISNCVSSYRTYPYEEGQTLPTFG
jgi:hypothetical protein